MTDLSGAGVSHTGFGLAPPSELEVIERALAWRAAGHDIMLVTVVSTFGSAPRPVGSPGG